jgi:hypothetical protein
METLRTFISKRQLHKYASLRFAFRNYNGHGTPKSSDVNLIFSTLDCLSLNDNVKPKIKLSKSRYGDYKYLIRDAKDDNNAAKEEVDFLPMSKVKVPFTPNGIWQAFLLYEAPLTIFPLGFHCDLVSKKLVINTNERSLFWDTNYPPEIPSNSSVLGLNDSYLPNVQIDGDKATLEYYFWNDWEGLIRVTQVARRKGFTISFNKPKMKVVFPYDCGLYL